MPNHSNCYLVRGLTGLEEFDVIVVVVSYRKRGYFESSTHHRSSCPQRTLNVSGLSKRIHKNQMGRGETYGILVFWWLDKAIAACESVVEMEKEVL